MQSTFCLFCVLALLVLPPFSARPNHPVDLDPASFERNACLGTVQGDELVTLNESAWLENHEKEQRGPMRAPTLLLRRGQRYQVQINFSEGSRRYGVFDKLVGDSPRSKGDWRLHRFQDWSRQNRGKGELNAADFGPSRQCLISFWAFDEAEARVNHPATSQEVYYERCSRSSRNEQGRTLTVFTFEFRRDALTATVELSR